MQELRGQGLSLPGVQEFRSLASQRFRRPGVQQEARSSGAQLFRKQEFLRTAVREAKSSWGHLVRKPGVSGANCSGGQEFLRPAVQGSGRDQGVARS